MDSLQQVRLNLGGDWNQKISIRVDNAIAAYLKGDIPSWFFNLKAIKFLIVSYLSKDAKKEIEDYERNISRLLNERKFREAGKLVEDYDVCIKHALDENGFLNPRQEDSTNIYGQKIS